MGLRSEVELAANGCVTVLMLTEGPQRGARLDLTLLFELGLGKFHQALIIVILFVNWMHYCILNGLSLQ